MASSSKEEEEQGDSLEHTGDESRVLAVSSEDFVGEPSGKYGSQNTENRVDANDCGSRSQIIVISLLEENGSPFIDGITAHVHERTGKCKNPDSRITQNCTLYLAGFFRT